MKTILDGFFLNVLLVTIALSSKMAIVCLHVKRPMYYFVKTKTGTIVNSEDADGMPQNGVFHLHCLLRKNRSPEKETVFFFWLC